MWSASNEHIIGIVKASFTNPVSIVGNTNDGYGYGSETGGLIRSCTVEAIKVYGASWTTGDTIGVAFDADAGTLILQKRCISRHSLYRTIDRWPLCTVRGAKRIIQICSVEFWTASVSKYQNAANRST